MAPGLKACIYCNHKELWKHGFYKDMQVYRCKSCGREFTELSKSKYSRHRFPKKTILFSVMLYRYGLSFYEISDILRKKFRTKVSARTICNWTRKFGNIKHLLRRLNIKFGKIWHMKPLTLKLKK